MTKKRKRAGQKGRHSYSTCRWCGGSVRNGVRFKAHVAACLWATKRQVKQATKGSKQPASTIRLGQFLSLPASKKIKVFLFALCSAHATCVYYIYIEIRVCPRLGAARADPPPSPDVPTGTMLSWRRLGWDLSPRRRLALSGTIPYSGLQATEVQKKPSERERARVIPERAERARCPPKSSSLGDRCR